MSLALLLSATLPPAPQPVDDKLACSVAMAWMADEVPHLYGLKFVYSSEVQSLPEPGGKLEWTQPGSKTPAPAPSRKLLNALVRAGQTNAEPHCPEFAPQMSALGVEFGPAALERANNAPRDAKPYIGGISMPVLSADGTEALLSASGGQSIYLSAALIHMRRDVQGRWRPVATASLWYF